MLQYIRNNHTISGRLQDELIMIDIHRGKYFSLNPVATRIWDMLEKARGINELCQDLTLEYEIDFEDCRRDVEAYLHEMVLLELVLVID